MKKKQFEPPRVVEWLCLSFESPVLAGSDQDNEAGGGNQGGGNNQTDDDFDDILP